MKRQRNVRKACHCCGAFRNEPCIGGLTGNRLPVKHDDRGIKLQWHLLSQKEIDRRLQELRNRYQQLESQR